jgi:enterochelin esterase family protein
MNKFLTLALLAVLVASLPAQERRRRERSDKSVALQHLKLSTHQFESAALGGRDASYNVYLPVDYEAEEQKDTRYPLVIWLHGMFEDADRFQGRGGAPVLDELVGSGKLPPLVFVCAEGNRSSFWTNAKVEDANYEDLIVRDLLAELDRRYRLDPRREKRAIMGVSMGGYGALKIALKHPDLFGIVAAHSAAVLIEDPDELAERYPWLSGRGGPLLASIFGDPIDVEKYRAENILHLAKTVEKDVLAGLKIYFDAGTRDRYKFHETNALLHEELEARKIKHVWRLVKDGGHSWGEGATQAALPHSLGFVAAQLAVADAGRGLGGLLEGGTEDAAGKPEKGKQDRDG